jgi:hypothetical protein
MATTMSLHTDHGAWRNGSQSERDPRMAAYITPTLCSNLSLLGDDDLTRATNRAYREAARSWADYRRSPSGDVGRLLLTSAEAAHEWLDMLRDERDFRDGFVTLQDDTLAVTYEVQAEAAQVAPWVRRALDSDLPSKSFDGLTPAEAAWS